MCGRSGLGLLVVFCGALPALGQSPVDLVPADALGGLVIRNVTELARKGDKLIEDTKLDLPLRISQLLQFVYPALGIPGGEVDESRPIAIIVASPKIIDPKAQKPTVNEQCLVVALPFKDLDRLEKALKLEAGILKGGQVVNYNNPMAGGNGLNRVAIRDRHFYLGSNEKVIKAVMKSKGLGGELSKPQIEFLGRSDVVLHLGTQAWGGIWDDILRDVRRNLEASSDETNRKVAEDFVEMLRGVKFGLASLRVDDGVGLSFLSVFPKTGNEAAKKFLTAFRGGEGASSLKGLPEGNVVAATAAKGNGSQNAPMARVFFRILVQEVLLPSRVLGASDRVALLTIFNEVWQRLRGSRLALYRTADATELGLFSLVGIMDTEDPQQFLEELKRLAKLGAADGLDFSTEATRKANEAEIEKLIKDLGHRRFQVRESAAAKLLLAGEPILPYLKKALESPDLEVKRTAERIKRDIVQAVELRRKELLSGELARSIKPSFAFTGKTEKVEGLEVQLVSVKLSKKDARSVPQLKALLGPDWHKVRLAVHGKQVVALVGSDLGLLQKAIRNLKENKPGLAATKVLQGQAKQTDAKRKIELHASAMMVSLLARAADLEKPAKVPANPPLSSIALSVEADRFQVDFWVPAAEIKAIAAANRQGP